MGKNPKERNEKEAIAINKMIRCSTIKLNDVAAEIRGLKVENARNHLEFSRKRIAREVKKTLESAIANAENNYGLDVDSLIVAQSYVGKTITMKRWKPCARGRVGRVIKPFSKLTIIVREVQEKTA